MGMFPHRRPAESHWHLLQLRALINPRHSFPTATGFCGFPCLGNLHRLQGNGESATVSHGTLGGFPGSSTRSRGNLYGHPAGVFPTVSRENPHAHQLKRRGPMRNEGIHLNSRPSFAIYHWNPHRTPWEWLNTHNLHLISTGIATVFSRLSRIPVERWKPNGFL